MYVEINTTLDHWKLERRGEVYIASDFHGFEGDPRRTIEEAFDSLEQRLDDRQEELFRRLALSRVKRSREEIHHTNRVGYRRLRRQQN